jgi:hypothetical protein
MKKSMGLSALVASAPALAHPGHEGLHGLAALDHPLGLVAFVLVSGLVLLAASWHSKRTARRTRKPQRD